MNDGLLVRWSSRRRKRGIGGASNNISYAFYIFLWLIKVKRLFYHPKTKVESVKKTSVDSASLVTISVAVII